MSVANGDFGIGTHTIYYTVTDAAGLSDSIGFTITVIDSVGPALFTNTQTLTLDSDGFATFCGPSDSNPSTVVDRYLWITQSSSLVRHWLASRLVHGVDSLGFHDSVQVPVTILPNPAGVIQSTLVTTDVLVSEIVMVLQASVPLAVACRMHIAGPLEILPRAFQD